MKLYTVTVAETNFLTDASTLACGSSIYPNCKTYYVLADSYSDAVSRLDGHKIVSVNLMASKTEWGEGVFEQID